MIVRLGKIDHTVQEKLDVESRFVDLESQLMQLQRDFEQLHSVCLAQTKQIQEQDIRVQRLETLISRLMEEITGGQDPASF